jgi:hypothetical protein
MMSQSQRPALFCGSTFGEDSELIVLLLECLRELRFFDVGKTEVAKEVSRTMRVS